jgi:RNA polymerase sigma-70 factor (ECF subfamily)
MSSVSDEELIARARQGDREAFGDLVERHQQAVFRAALVVLRSREDAEEVVQDTFVSAYRKLDAFRGDSSFRTWLLAIAWNRAVDRRRRVRGWLRRFVSRDEGHAAEPASQEPSHERLLVDAEGRRMVRRLLAALPRRYREPLLLSAGGECTFAEIAALLKIPVGTAKWRAMEGRRLLRKKLEALDRGETAGRFSAEPGGAGDPTR